MTPDHGPAVGNTTLTPPALHGIRFSQVSARSVHSMVIGFDGNHYTWGATTSNQNDPPTTAPCPRQAVKAT